MGSSWRNRPRTNAAGNWLAPMNSRELEFAIIVQQEFGLHGHIPSYERVDELMTCTRAFYTRCLESEDVRNHLRTEGIRVEQLLQERTGALSAEQLKCINTLLDFNDNRSDRQKLKALNIPSTTYAAWKKDPGFQAYMQQRAENLFGDNLDEVHRALLDNARSGDISSIKLIYELTGRHNPNAKEPINTRQVLTLVIESIMRHVKDPAAIEAVAADLRLIIQSQQTGTAPVIEAVADKALTA